MKRTRYSEEQIIVILTEHDAGAKCADLCRKHGMSEAKRLEALEDENARLKRLLTEQMLDIATMKELLSKKW